jgi:hypothetical protein
VFATTAFAKDWRHRHIAHRNLQLALNQNAEPLAHGSRLTVTAAVKATADFLGLVGKLWQLSYGKDRTRYRD